MDELDRIASLALIAWSAGIAAWLCWTIYRTEMLYRRIIKELKRKGFR